jgi:hypothetical protein
LLIQNGAFAIWKAIGPEPRVQTGLAAGEAQKLPSADKSKRKLKVKSFRSIKTWPCRASRSTFP